MRNPPRTACSTQRRSSSSSTAAAAAATASIRVKKRQRSGCTPGSSRDVQWRRQQRRQRSSGDSPLWRTSAAFLAAMASPHAHAHRPDAFTALWSSMCLVSFAHARLSLPSLSLSHPGYFGKVGMRYFHKSKNLFFCPTINVEKLCTLISEEARTKVGTAHSSSHPRRAVAPRRFGSSTTPSPSPPPRLPLAVSSPSPSRPSAYPRLLLALPPLLLRRRRASRLSSTA